MFTKFAAEVHTHTHASCSSGSFIVTLSLIQRTAFSRAQFSGCSATTNVHSETGQMAVCCQNLTLGALSSPSALSMLFGALFKKFCLFLNTPRSVAEGNRNRDLQACSEMPESRGPSWISTFVNLTWTTRDGMLSIRFLNLLSLNFVQGARGGAVGWGTALQTRRSRFRFPMFLLEFFTDTMILVALRAWGWLNF